MKKLLALLVFSFAAIAPAQASPRYISDDLYTYMHRGPGTEYRITGAIDAGTKVTILSVNGAAGYTKVRDGKGHEGWVESKFVSKQPSYKARFGALETELTEVKETLAQANEQAKVKTSGLTTAVEQYKLTIKDLEARNLELNDQLSADQAMIRELQAKIDTQKDDLLMRWFTYGAMVAGLGLILGLLLPHLVPSRRKKDRWM
ncbi:hypothetical protein VST7929_00313 [Vibrio stylophorae]|uniref:SH3b domain-containing protein n=1 Tax=Vibrio stylophorae TaxID=659351 RepID=A0ABM8ZQL0_9VIBR|nr:TIGR04211 family SH3 domain-containing protein [Vibrio stylophorae]CAH0532483.1 hypothetical protein VST7929_00313 [Vibrio stylophorae]